MEQDDQFVTVVITQVVKPGCESAYETWLKDITSVSRTYVGHLGTNVIRPQLGVRNEYVIIFRFDGYENLKVWMTSRDREYWLNQGKHLVESDPYVQQISGLEAWFSLPGQPLKTPPRYKTALLTWAVVFVLINILSKFLVPLLRGLPPLIVSLIVTIIMVVLLTYVVMPRVSRLFSWWLYAK
ncbi:MAG: antibiotic biosynthesis monooxygenase [Nostoc sp. NMS1]|uniref:antibiotic biosynthesis monooxygenase n=1 Tax=unclassified Nostoc TaxID=2593658 RepID=UPI0025EB2AA1|nr:MULTISPECIES: antibiotic biosynthesis monooxygenase [unclassified Nostoc]MBN3908179.1 antibiotic biosynthesis monooxygenase [Nostoc sp. NMS1]MBN3994145.1 antibiotic biosynthesis monooxygenase [Nostoc sp. NMS2]